MIRSSFVKHCFQLKYFAIQISEYSFYISTTIISMMYTFWQYLYGQRPSEALKWIAKNCCVNFDKKLWRILKYGGSKRDEFSFFRDIYVTNGWHVHLHKAYRHKNRTTSVHLVELNHLRLIKQVQVTSSC